MKKSDELQCIKTEDDGSSKRHSMKTYTKIKFYG